MDSQNQSPYAPLVVLFLTFAGFVAIGVALYMGYCFIDNDINGIENGPVKNIFVVAGLTPFSWGCAWLLNRADEAAAVPPDN